MADRLMIFFIHPIQFPIGNAFFLDFLDAFTGGMGGDGFRELVKRSEMRFFGLVRLVFERNGIPLVRKNGETIGGGYGCFYSVHFDAFSGLVTVFAGSRWLALINVFRVMVGVALLLPCIHAGLLRFENILHFFRVRKALCLSWLTGRGVIAADYSPSLTGFVCEITWVVMVV